MNAPIWYPVVLCTIGGTIIGVVKKTGTYPYKRIGVILIGAILPLILGSSVGPEAGMAVSLSVLFASPLFGFFSAVVFPGSDGNVDLSCSGNSESGNKE